MSLTSNFQSVNGGSEEGLRFLTPGAVINPNLYSNLKTEDDLYNAASEANSELRDYVELIAKGSMDIDHGNIKSRTRTKQKADSEKNGNISGITDIVRSTIYVKDVKGIVYLANNLSTAWDPKTIYIEDSFIRPNVENHQRRLKVLRRLSNGMIGEIMVKHIGMKDCDTATREAYGLSRAIESAMSDLGDNNSNYRAVKILRIAFKKANDLRRSLTNDCAEKHGLNSLRVEDHERSFYKLPMGNEGAILPVMLMPDPYRQRKEIAVIPDVERGILVVANDYIYKQVKAIELEIHDDHTKALSYKTNRKGFVGECQFLCEYYQECEEAIPVINANQKLSAL